jgi:hypothetical protein
MAEQTRPKPPPLTESQKATAQDRADQETGGVEAVRSAIQEAKDALDRAEEALDAVAEES